MELVPDTDVIVAALRSPSGASAALLRLVEEDRVTLLLSVALALEYDAICQLPEHCMAAGISQGDAKMFVTTLISMARPVEIHFRWRPQLRDAGDEMVLETAVNGGADALVTFDHRDYGVGPQVFGIPILLPREALRRIVR